jgi:hypothetical protein
MQNVDLLDISERKLKVVVVWFILCAEAQG